jgi:hypothetical protein
MRSLTLLVLFPLFGCLSPTVDLGSDRRDGSATNVGDCPTPAYSLTPSPCIVGSDQTCNDQTMNSFAGTCQGGNCSCYAGFVINPATGRCHHAVDAGSPPQCVCEVPGSIAWDPIDGIWVCVSSGDGGEPDAGCGTDCRTTNCAPPNGLCPAQDNVACDPTSGDWVCVPTQDAGPLTTDAGGVCTVGQDWTCNDDPAMQALAGTCLSGGVCKCNSGFVINPSTGRCMLQPGDAGCSPDCRVTNCAPPNGLCPTQDSIACDPTTGTWVCLASDAGSGDAGNVTCWPPGNNGNCNGDPNLNISEGTCQANGQCLCNAPYAVLNPSTGLCYIPMDFADVGTQLDAGSACDPSSCAGCCDSNGTCQNGSLTSACGHGGEHCAVCSAGQCCADPGICM